MAEEFKILADENIANAVVEQLIKNGIVAERVQKVLPEGTTDPDLLEYCYQHGYTLVTLDRGMDGHAANRINSGKEHAGVFIGANLQGPQNIGTIVNFIVLYDEAIKGAAASVEDDVYNKIIYIR